MSQDKIECRELRWADFPAYQKLLKQASGEFERATGLDEAADALYEYLHRRSLWTVLALMRALGRAPIRLFVGTDHGQVLGSAGLLPLQRAGYVIGVVTDSSARNRGVASSIMGEVHRVAKSQGKPWTALDVETDNETAVRLYRRLGYEERMRFNWHVGPTPATATPAAEVREVPRSEIEEVAAWVRLQQPEAIRDPLPANSRMLSHLDNVAQMPGSRAKTWRVSQSGHISAAVRGYFVPVIKTVFAVPAAWEPAASSEIPRSLLAPVVGWARELGATRTVAAVPEPPGAWEEALRTLGLPKAVSTDLMVRPSSL